jgi:hypothetical protein
VVVARVTCCHAVVDKLVLTVSIDNASKQLKDLIGDDEVEKCQWGWEK